MLLLLALACSSSDDRATLGIDTSRTDTDTGASDPDGDSGPDDSGTDSGTGGEPCYDEPLPPAEKDTGEAPRPGVTLSGTITWTLSFDATAEAAGYTDCSYTRAYTQAEVGDQGYLCPSCSVLTTGTSVMTEGYEDCFAQISSADAERVEHLGLAEVDGVPHLFRSGTENVALTDMGAAVGTDTLAVSWEDSTELEAGGTMQLAAAGTLTPGVDETALVPDVTGARTEPYACGWPMNNPGGPNPGWTLADGELFPNLRLVDQCGEPMDTWDFRGFYVVIDSSAPNCGPCQVMADGAEAFKAQMAAECIPVEMITLLNESLSAINQPASLETQQDWAETYGLTSPVLADRGAAYALFPEYLGEEDGMSYPAVVLVDPDGRVFYGATGFGDWSEFADAIRADWAGR